MNVYGKSFEFNGTSSEKYGVVLCTFESSNDNKRNTSISYDIISGEINPYRAIPNFYFKKYKNVLTFTVEICKACGNTTHFTTQEQKEIVQWITSPTDYRKFIVVDSDGKDYHDTINYFCICTDYGESVVNENIFCMYFEFQCNAPYGFYEEKETLFSSTTDTPASFIINNISDEIEEDYYPTILLSANYTGTVTIANQIYPDEKMILSLKNGQVLTIDCKESDIVDNINSFNYNSDTNLKWLHLKPGKNTIHITGDVTGSIKCQYPRKVGI